MGAFQPSAPDVFAKLGESFDPAAAEFVDALEELPERISLEAIARQGSGLLRRYEDAEEAKREMDRIANLRGQLVDVLGYTAGGDHVTEALTRFARIENALALANLKSLGRVEPWARWLAIVRAEGCELAWQSHEDQRKTYARLTAQAEPVPRDRGRGWVLANGELARSVARPGRSP